MLSPSDLGIQKQSFVARPTAKQVAIFRVEHINRLEPKYRRIYDQIYWKKEGDEVVVNVVIAPLSFYVGTPESDGDRPATFFRDSWNLRAGSYRHDVTEYSFVGSSFGSGNTNLSIRGLGLSAKIGSSYAQGEIVYTKNSETESKDLEFKFTMFVVSIEDAKKMHPKIDINPDETTTSWKAAYFLDTQRTEQESDGDAK